ELQHLHGILHPPVMLAELEDEKLLVLRAPVAANALEHPGAVMKGVGHQTQTRVAVPLELAVEIDPVLGLLFPTGFSRARDALCLDRHRQTTSFGPVTNRPGELGSNSRSETLNGLYARLRQAR